MFETPEVKVGDVYPRLDCSSSPDSVASPETEASFWDLRKSKRKSDAKKLRHGARRVLELGSEVAKRTKFLKKKLQKKLQQSMKWHPATMARKAEKEIKKIDPGYGYKIVITRDESVPPPPMPKTPPMTPSPEPPCLNEVLMKAASKTKAADGKGLFDDEEEKKPAPVKSKQVPKKQSKACLGCGLGTCLNARKLQMAVDSANSTRNSDMAVVLMSRKERCHWFVSLYKVFDPENCNDGLACALRYANKEMTYLTAAFLLEYGFPGEADDGGLSMSDVVTKDVVTK